MANKTISELNPATLSNDLAMVVESSTETQKTTIADLKAFVGADKQDKLTAGDNISIEDNTISSRATFQGKWNATTQYHFGDIVQDVNHRFHIAKQDNKGFDPNLDNNNWLYMDPTIVDVQYKFWNDDTQHAIMFGANTSIGVTNIFYGPAGKEPTMGHDGVLKVPGGIEGYQTTTEADAKYLTTASIEGKQDTSNLVTSLSAESTDTQYPSAKCVYDLLGDIETLLSQI